MSCHSLLPCSFYVEKSADDFMDVLLYVICHFVFNILPLFLIFVNLITVCFDVFLLGFFLPGNLCASWTWLSIFFPMLGTHSAVMSSNISSDPYSLSSPSGTHIM